MSTQRISADEAHHLRRDNLRSGADGRERMFKSIEGPPSSWDSTRRSARFVMTSQARDRAGDAVVTAGIDTTAFERNPSAFLNHDSTGWPIGRWENLQKKPYANPPRMEGDLVLLESGGPVALIDQAAWMLSRGAIRGASIGFIPDWNAIEKLLESDGSWTGGLQFNQSELLEVSLVNVPANADALAKALAGPIERTRSPRPNFSAATAFGIIGKIQAGLRVSREERRYVDDCIEDANLRQKVAVRKRLALLEAQVKRARSS